MKKWFNIFFIFFAFGLLLYFNSLNNQFLFDDYGFLNNPLLSSTKYILSQWNPYREQALGVMDNRENLGYYRPMAHMVLDFCYAAFKNNFWQYHLFNLILFVFASSLIYLLIQKMTGNYILAFLAGLFYLIHPVNGIMVNYISACVFAFQVVFMLGTILLLLASLDRKNDLVCYFLSLASCFLSLFWNESGVMTPFYISVVILLFRKNPFKEKALCLLPYFLIIFSFIVFRLNFLGINEHIVRNMSNERMTGLEYLAALFRIYAWYISKLFYPQGIVMQWATPILHSHITMDVLGFFLLLIISLMFFVRFLKEKVCQLALAWVLIGFAPVCLAAFRLPENGVQIEPHWFVFSSIGFFILAAYGCSMLLARRQSIGLGVLFIITFFWGSISFADNQLWADQKTYALYWSQQVPNLKLTYIYLADAYQNQGAFNESRKFFRLALSGYPSDADIYNNLGLIDQSEHHSKDAELNYKMALKINPRAANTYNNLGALYYAEGQWGKAKENFDRSLIYNPFLLDARRGLAYIFLNQGKYQQAIGCCLKNLEIDNNDSKTVLVMIYIYSDKKDVTQLTQYLSRFLSIEGDPVVLTGLGMGLSQYHYSQLALDCFTKAMRVAPDYKYSYLLAGKQFFISRQYDEAIHYWKMGSSIDPMDKNFKQNIAEAEESRLRK